MNVCLNKTLAKIWSSKRWLTKRNQQQVIRDVRANTGQWAYRPSWQIRETNEEKKEKNIGIIAEYTAWGI